MADYVRDLKSFFCVKLSHYRFPAIGLKRKVLCYLQAFILYTRETQHNGSGKVWPNIALRNPREEKVKAESWAKIEIPFLLFNYPQSFYLNWQRSWGDDAPIGLYLRAEPGTTLAERWGLKLSLSSKTIFLSFDRFLAQAFFKVYGDLFITLTFSSWMEGLLHSRATVHLLNCNLQFRPLQTHIIIHGLYLHAHSTKSLLRKCPQGKKHWKLGSTWMKNHATWITYLKKCYKL